MCVNLERFQPQVAPRALKQWHFSRTTIASRGHGDDCELESHDANRLRTRMTCSACHLPPAAVGTPREPLISRTLTSRSYPTFRNLCSERRLSGRGLSLKVCGQLVHDTSPT